MKPDLPALLEIVDGATPGPWSEQVGGAWPSEADATFIATFNPALLHDLLTRMQRLEAVAEVARAGHRFPGHDCLPFQESSDEGTSWCSLCAALAALDEPEGS